MIDVEKPLTVAPRRPTIAERLRLADMDRVMLCASVVLIAFSVFTLASVTGDEVAGRPLDFALRQGIYGLIGVALMLAVARLDYTRLRGHPRALYALMIATILLVLLLAATVRGSQRWIELPYLSFQPSELAKLLLIVSLAGFAFERARRRSRLRDTVLLLGLGLAPAALVSLQPDLGSAIVLAVATLAVLFVAGVPWQHFALIGAVAATLLAGALAAGPALGIDLLRGYQADRLTAFLNPSDNPGDTSYQVNQSVIAFGSGGPTGRGDDATQAELLFLPERHTDFIFATTGERFGFAGAALVLVLYALLVWRSLRALTSARSFYGTLIAAGVTAALLFQVLVNVGMNLGLMPVAGIPLPLMSYGGSSVLATFLALGLLQSIHVQARRPPRLASGRYRVAGRSRRGRQGRLLPPLAQRRPGYTRGDGRASPHQ